MAEQDSLDLAKLLEQGYQGAPEVDLVDVAWQRGRQRRRRRLGVAGAGVTGLLAASAALAIALGGGWPAAQPDPGPAIPPSLPAPTQDDPTEEPGTEEPHDTVSLSNGYVVDLPSGWTAVPLWDHAESGDSEVLVFETCLVDVDEFVVTGCPGVQVITGATENQLLQEPVLLPTVYSACESNSENQPEVPGPARESEVEIGGGISAFQAEWEVPCPDGSTVTAMTWRAPEAELYAAAIPATDEHVEVVNALSHDPDATELTSAFLSVDDDWAGTLSGTVARWNFGEQGVPLVRTDDTLTLTPTAQTHCAVEHRDPEMVQESRLELVDCSSLLPDMGAGSDGDVLRVVYAERTGELVTAIHTDDEVTQ